MRKVSVKDDIRGKILLRKARIESQLGDNGSAKQLLDSLSDLFSNKDSFFELSVSELLNGTIAFDNGDYDEAIAYYQKAFLMKQKLGDKSGSAACLFNIAVINRRQNKIDEAISNLDEAYILYKKSKKELKIADVIAEKNSIHFIRKEYKKIIETTHIEAIFKKHKAYRSLIIHYQYIADAYFMIRDTKNAYKYNRNSIKIAKTINNASSLINMIMKKGYYLYKSGQKSESIILYREAAQIADNYMGHNRTRAMAYYNYASILQEHDENEEANRYFHQVLNLAPLHSDIYIEAKDFINKYKKEEK